MAIEQYTFASANDLKDLVESLDWFDTVSIDGVYVVGSLNNVDTLFLCAPTVGQGSSNKFYTGTRWVEMNASSSVNYTLVYGFKTKNGLLLTHDTSNCRSQVLLGKTNNGNIAVCMSQSADQYSKTQFYSAAVGESDPAIGGVGRLLTIGNAVSNTAERYRWVGTSQITSCPIPTCPTNGTSYIKGAKMFITTTLDSLGIVEIDGVKYATTGDLALNDE